VGEHSEVAAVQIPEVDGVEQEVSVHSGFNQVLE